MKKALALFALVLCFTLSFNTFTSAKGQTTEELNKKITQLEAEITKLKKQIPTVYTGKIFMNGVQSNSSNFVTIGGKTYVEVDKIVPLLTGYEENQVKFDDTKKSLYLGTIPSKGTIGLTNLEKYKENWIDVDEPNVYINKQKISKSFTNDHNNLSTYAYITYKIDSKYSSLQFLYGMEESGHIGSVIVEGDGNELFNSGDIDYQEDAKYADVDIEGVKFLTIKIDNYTVVGNPTLTP